MSKVIFGIVLLFTVSSMCQSLKTGSGTSDTYADVLKCFGEIFEKQIGSEIVINADFAQEVTDFLARASSQIFNDNSEFKPCLAKFPSLDAEVSACNAAVSNGKCEIINSVIVAKPCPTGYSRISSTNTDHLACYQTCPEGFTVNGPICEKPDTYVLNHFTKELDCIQVNGGKPCSIYHVRYFAPDCKENHYRLGSTVCIPKCPKNTVDGENHCVRPSVRAPIYKTLDMRSK